MNSIFIVRSALTQGAIQEEMTTFVVMTISGSAALTSSQFVHVNFMQTVIVLQENSSELEVSFKSSSEVYRRTIDTHKSGEFRDFNNGRTEKFTTQACAGNNDHNG